MGFWHPTSNGDIYEYMTDNSIILLYNERLFNMCIVDSYRQ